MIQLNLRCAELSEFDRFDRKCTSLPGTLCRISRVTGERRFLITFQRKLSLLRAQQRRSGEKRVLEEVSHRLKASGGRRATSTAIGDRFQWNRLELSGRKVQVLQKSPRDRGKRGRVCTREIRYTDNHNSPHSLPTSPLLKEQQPPRHVADNVNAITGKFIYIAFLLASLLLSRPLGWRTSPR